MLSGKSSLPNFCIFLFFRLSLVHYLFRNRSRIVLWYHCNPSRLDLESSQELWESGSSPLRSRDSPLGIQGLSPRLLSQVREHDGALECCVMALEVWCRSFPLRPFFFVAPEDRGGQVHNGPASIWQFEEVIGITKRTCEAVRSSAFACELRAADCPRPIAFISNLSQISSDIVRGWPELQRKGNFLHYSGPLRRDCFCGQPHRYLRGISHDGKFATGASPLFAVEFLTQVLEAASKALRDGAVIPEKGFHEVQSKDQISLTTLHHRGSPILQIRQTDRWTCS